MTWQPSTRLPRPQRSIYASTVSGVMSDEGKGVVPTPTPDPAANAGESIVTEEVPSGEVIPESGVIYEDGGISGETIYLDDSYSDGTVIVPGEEVFEEGFHDHNFYGSEVHDPYGVDPACETCHSHGRLCICLPEHGWFQADYLMWYQNGMSVPPLVTTSAAGTARANAGVLGLPTTSVLLGDEDLLGEEMSGGRIRFGWWFSRLKGWGIEGEFVGAGSITDTIQFQSTGSPILARPFFNMTTGREDAELVAFPGVLTGSINTTATSQFNGAAFRLRRQLCGSEGCGTSWLDCAPVPVANNTDITMGYRFYELDESLSINEQLISQVVGEPGSFNITDKFNTLNQFNGPEFGVQWRGRRGFWSLDLLMRMAMGINHQTVTISGSSAVTDNGNTTTYATGVLAQRTNIGEYDRDRFAVVPELGATLGYQLTQCWKLNLGYSFIYWSSVVRPGDQIDTDVNPNLFAPEQTPFTGPLRPEFHFVESDYWIQGLNLGAEYRW